METIDVHTGRVEVSCGDALLRSTAVGSCVVIIAYDPHRKIGAFAHIMLPGKAPPTENEKTKYAADAVDHMIEAVKLLGSDTHDLQACLAGGANVLLRDDDAICRDNIRSATDLLKEREIPVCASAVGGTARRSVTLDVARGAVYFTEGDSRKKRLWQFRSAK